MKHSACHQAAVLAAFALILAAPGYGAPSPVAGEPAAPAAGVLAGAPACANAAVQPSFDYTYAAGSADFVYGGDPEAGSLYRWLKNGSPITSTQPVSESLLLHFDNSPAGANGETPSQAVGVAYTSGHWGQALVLSPTGSLRYPRANNYDPAEGTVEMWVAPRADGSDQIVQNPVQAVPAGESRRAFQIGWHDGFLRVQ